MRYIPGRISEISDYLGFMVLTCPDRFPPRNQLDLDSAFATLLEGMEAVRANLGEERYRDLVDMAGEAKGLYRQGDEIGGAHRLQDMKERLKRKADPD